MLVNKDIILENFKEQPDEYRKHFPSMIQEIDQLAKKPKCGVCINGFFKKLLSYSGFQKKMAIIFDDPEIKFSQDVQDYLFTGIDKPAIKSKSKVEVYFVSVKEVKTFIESYTADKLVRSIQTVYVPSEIEGHSGKIMVTIHWSSL